MNKLNGKKTYIGLTVSLLGVLGVGKYIGSEHLTEILNVAFELGGLLIATYGRYKAQPKN